MAFQVVRVALMFTGAEAGRSCATRLSTTQLDALIEHQWPDNKVADNNDPLKFIIENIKKQSHDSESKKAQASNVLKKKVNYDSLANSKDSRLKTVLDIGRRLRREGVYS